MKECSKHIEGKGKIVGTRFFVEREEETVKEFDFFVHIGKIKRLGKDKIFNSSRFLHLKIFMKPAIVTFYAC